MKIQFISKKSNHETVEAKEVAVLVSQVFEETNGPSAWLEPLFQLWRRDEKLDRGGRQNFLVVSFNEIR